MKTPQQIVTEATKAADEAGSAWMKSKLDEGVPGIITVVDGFTGRPVGRMLDLCGNAHLEIKDKRSKVYKEFKKAGLIDEHGRATVTINHRYVARQEHGLHLACINAAKEIFIQNGITNVAIWSYID